MQSEHQQRIMGYFIEEAKDHLNTIEQGLLNLQETLADPEMVNEVFRAAHSVKGGAAMLGLNAIQRVAHRLEDFFKILKETPIKVDEELKSLFLRTSDALEDLLGQLQGPFGLTEDVANATVAEVEPVFVRLEQHLSKLAGSPIVASEPMTAGVGVAATPVVAAASNQALQQAFKAEVPGCLRDMLQLFKQSDTDPATRQQLQELCQRLIRIGEQFNLSDWNHLVAMAERAIAHSENSYRALAPVIIKDIKQAQDLVLVGCANEIVPCAQLQELAPPAPVEAIAEELIGFEDDFADLLEVTDSQAELLAELDMGADVDLGLVEEPALDLSFDELEPISPLDAPPSIAATDLDSSFVSLSALDAELDSQHGPEVGMAELNTLADLFEGEDSELGLNWQEEEVLGDNTELLAVTATEITVDDSSDFSDLLFDEPESTSASSQSQDQDLSDLFGDEFLEDDSSDLLEIEPTPVAPIAADDSEELTDLFDLSESAESSESELELADLANGAEAIAFGEDLFGNGAGSDSVTDFTPLDAPLDLDAAADLETPGEGALGNLGELFAGLDEGDLTPADALPEFGFDDFNPAEMSMESETIADSDWSDFGDSPIDATVPDLWGAGDDLAFTEAATDRSAADSPLDLTGLSVEQTADLDDLLAEDDSEGGVEFSLDEDAELSDLFGSTDDLVLATSDDLADSAIDTDSDSWLTNAMDDTAGDASLDADLAGFAGLDVSSEPPDEPFELSLDVDGLNLSSTSLDDFSEPSLSEVAAEPWVMEATTEDLSALPGDAFTSPEPSEPELSTPDVEAFDFSDLELDSHESAAPELTTDELDLDLSDFGLEPSVETTELADAPEQDLDDLFGDQPLTEETAAEQDLDDLFGDQPLTEETAAEQDLDDLFGDQPLTEEMAAEQDLDDLFGGEAVLEETAAEQDLDDLFSDQPLTEGADLDDNFFSDGGLEAELPETTEPLTLDFADWEQAEPGIEVASAQNLNDLFGETTEASPDPWLEQEPTEPPIDLTSDLVDLSLEPTTDAGGNDLLGDIPFDEAATPELRLETEAADLAPDALTLEPLDGATIGDDLFGDLTLDEATPSELELSTGDVDLATDLFAGDESELGLEPDNGFIDFADLELSVSESEPSIAEAVDFRDDLSGDEFVAPQPFDLELNADLAEMAAEPAIDLAEDLSFADLNLEQAELDNIPAVTIEATDDFPADLFADADVGDDTGAIADLELGDLALDSAGLDNLGDLLGDRAEPSSEFSANLESLSTDEFTPDLTDTSADLDDLFTDVTAESPESTAEDTFEQFAELDNFLSEPFTSEPTDDLWATDSTPEITDNFADLDHLLGDEPLEAATSDRPEAIFIPEATDSFADLDNLLEPEAIAATADSFTDLDALLDDETATPGTDEFSELDQLIGGEAPPAITTDEFSELDNLLGDDQAGVTNEFAELDDLLGDDSAALPNEFAELEDLLGEAEVNVAPSSGMVDEFADLEALLGQEAVSPIASSTAQPSSVAPAIESEFDELDNLLKDAEEKMGGSPTIKGRQRVAPVTTRRSTRPGHGFVEQTMRVPVKHLDNLSNLVGELVVNRNSLEGDQERLRQSLDNLLYQVQQLSDVGQRMQDLYERSLLESSLLASRQGYRVGALSHTRETHPTHSSTGMEYDPLEMDRFTGFHSLSQEMIELIVRVRESSSDIEFIVDETEQVTRMFRQVTTQLQEGLTRSRMVPFAQTADRLPRAVRDISLKVGKQAELNVEGRETLIDKMILEQLYDPMTHLVNNAITHGIESPEVRRAAGKPPAGRITIRAFHQGNQTIISVSDDGAGIDVERVKKKAIEKGLLTPSEAKGLSRLDIYDILFHPGFSTKDQADDFSGRGVGMDVVRTSLSEIRGVINTDSNPGKGTTFTIRLPLTLSISKALCCVSDRARIAFPMDGVEDMLDVPRERIQTNAEGQPCIPWRDTLLPVRPLTELLSYNRHLSRGNVYGGNQEDDIVSIVVLRSAGNFLALQVDQVLGEQEIVIKQLEGPVPKPVGVAGATVLGDGRIMPIADVLELIDLSMGRLRKDVNTSLWGEQTGGDLLQEAPAAKSEPMVLIVDDSITVRELLSMTFNKVGYRVEQARDGQEAWEKLRSGLPCDIVFCDIEMPRMDGLELLSRIQKDPNLKQLPIAMLTSRGADRHRQMAASLGASGYFTKPYLEEALLDAAQRMLKGEVLLSSS
ncbi:response regulator [Pantanalinema rosaneae CENA516]|uniref:response regulator n=1 Tax=Pantanalinema rosaneae TaxID=1620701 RepID=UPI003D6F45E9